MPKAFTCLVSQTWFPRIGVCLLKPQLLYVLINILCALVALRKLLFMLYKLYTFCFLGPAFTILNNGSFTHIGYSSFQNFVKTSFSSYFNRKVKFIKRILSTYYTKCFCLYSIFRSQFHTSFQNVRPRNSIAQRHPI